MSYNDLLGKLKQKADQFSAHLGDLNNLNNAAREKAEALRKALQEFPTKETQPTCSVCYTNPPTHALLGCGHGLYCQTCAERALSRNRCFLCRARIESIVRIYMN